MPSTGAQYAEHLEILQQRWAAALEAQSLDAALVAAGAAHGYFLDDQAAPFRANPHFRQWLPEGEVEHSLLLIRPGQPPHLYFHQPRDFWHLPPAAPAGAQEHMRLEIFSEREPLLRSAHAELGRHARTAFIGEPDRRETPADVQVNPEPLLDQLHYYRALKTEFERDCVRHANELAARGHLAARRAFREGGSEYDIHMAYLLASRQNETALPYPSIVGLNEHAGTLHYQHYERDRPEPTRSLLIDAGARHLGYASDVTRSYASEEDSPAEPARVHRALIARLDERQRRIVDAVRPGEHYPALQEHAHREIGELLAELELVRCSGEEAFERGLTDAFFPHGLGHLIGLQTHDIGGQLVSPAGERRAPDARFPALRLTRPIAEGMIFTIEPGLYFIELLLEPLRQEPRGEAVNWPLVDALRPFGGIRIEDDVLVTGDGVVNLTRAAFAEAERA